MSSNILKKLSKLRVMVDRAGTQEERDTASSIINNILSKYNLSETDVQLPESRSSKTYKILKGTYNWVVRVAHSMDIECYSSMRKDYIRVVVSESEWDLFYAYAKIVEKRYFDKKRELLFTLKSYMVGYVEKGFPLQDPKCPNCNSVLVLNLKKFRYACNSCDYIGPRLRSIDVNSGYELGLNDGNDILDNKGHLLTYKTEEGEERS